MLYPIEIKKAAAISQDSARHFAVLNKLKQPIGHGAVICLRETHVQISQGVTAVPVGYL